MKIAAILLGCVFAFVGGWVATLFAAWFSSRTGGGWGLPYLATAAFVVAALLGILAGNALVGHMNRLP